MREGSQVRDFVSGYVRRVIDRELDELLPDLPAILLDGPKGVGKTETALQRAGAVYRLDDPAQAAIVAADPAVMLDDTPPVLIDEWQRVPHVWDAVKRRVDTGLAGGQVLLTGSAVPAGGYATHSGAGRITALRMRPLTLGERGLAVATVSLGELLTGELGALSGSSGLTLQNYTDEVVNSGFPGMRHLPGRALRTQLDGYVTRVVEHDMTQAGLKVRRTATVLAWLRAYAAATSTTSSYEKIRDAATTGIADKPAKTTTIPYTDVLTALRVLDPVPAWTPSMSRLQRLTSSPKHQLADPALAARLLEVDARALLRGAPGSVALPRDGTLLGALFEALVTLSIRVYAQACEAEVFHLRVESGRHEVDLIVEGADGRLVAVEVKLSPVVDDDDVRHLQWLRKRAEDRVADAIVVTTGPKAYRRPDGIGVVPLALLGV